MRRYRANKYGNKKTVLDGITFDSRAEARRYAELKLMEKAGEIHGLELQMPFILQASFTDKHGKKQSSIKYIADLAYFDNDGELVIEDVKSPATRKNAVYRMKKKMMAYRGYEITEV